MFALVYLCLLLFTSVSCLLVHDYIYLPIFTPVYLRLLLFTYVYHCLLVFTYVYSCYLCLPLYSCMFTYVNPCLLILTYDYSCLPMFTRVYLCLQQCIRAWLPIFTNVL